MKTRNTLASEAARALGSGDDKAAFHEKLQAAAGPKALPAVSKADKG